MADILVVDDDVQMRKLMRLLMQKEGHEVAEAGDGVAALRHLQGKGFDLMVTDVVMPDMDGLELILKAHKSNPGLRILAVSGGGQGDPELYLNLAEHFGADAVLFKPFKPEALAAEVRKWVARAVN